MEIHLEDDLLYFREGDEINVVPVEAIASWGELLGLSDEDALNAILSGYQPPVLTDHPDDQGWLAPYIALTEATSTRAAVERAVRQPVLATDAQYDTNTLSLMGAFGPELVIAHAEAIQEDVQRTARRVQPLPAEAPIDGADQIVTDLADLIAERRQAFRAAFTPQPEEGTA